MRQVQGGVPRPPTPGPARDAARLTCLAPGSCPGPQGPAPDPRPPHCGPGTLPLFSGEPRPIRRWWRAPRPPALLTSSDRAERGVGVEVGFCFCEGWTVVAATSNLSRRARSLAGPPPPRPPLLAPPPPRSGGEGVCPGRDCREGPRRPRAAAVLGDAEAPSARVALFRSVPSRTRTPFPPDTPPTLTRARAPGRSLSSRHGVRRAPGEKTGHRGRGGRRPFVRAWTDVSWSRRRARAAGSSEQGVLGHSVGVGRAGGSREGDSE